MKNDPLFDETLFNDLLAKLHREGVDTSKFVWVAGPGALTHILALKGMEVVRRDDVPPGQFWLVGPEQFPVDLVGERVVC